MKDKNNPMLKKLFLFLIVIVSITKQSQAQIITTIAGNGIGAGGYCATCYGGDGAQATNAELSTPRCISLDRFGNLFIVDEYNYRIRKVNRSTGIISTIAGNGNYGYAGDGGPATNAELYQPEGIFVNDSGNVFIADTYNYVIRKVNGSTGIISTIAGNGTAGYAGDGGLATNAKLNRPDGVFIDGAGNIFISDGQNYRIRKINNSTGIISTIAGNGTGTYSGDGGQATSAGLTGPAGIFVDRFDNVFIADYWCARIRKINGSTGIISTIAGSGIAGYLGDGGQATSAQIDNPMGVFVDSIGNVFIADQYNNRIRKVDVSTGIITTIAGSATQGYGGDGGNATSGELYLPLGVFMDGSGNMFIADGTNNRIRMVTAPLQLNVNSPQICSGTSTTLTASGANSYTWSTNDTGASIVVSPIATINYTVTGTNTLFNISNASTGTVVSTVSVSPIPLVNYTLTNVSPHYWDAVPAYSANVDSTRWYWGDGHDTLALYPSHVYSTPGRYNICVTAYSACGDSAQYCQNDTVYRASNSTMVYINVDSSSAHNTNLSHISSLNTQVSLYPNPNNGTFTLQLNEYENSSVEVYNIIGECVYHQPTTSTINQINMAGFANGMYQLRVLKNNNPVYQSKILKQE